MYRIRLQQNLESIAVLREERIHYNICENSRDVLQECVLQGSI